MAAWRIIVLAFASSVFAEGKWYQHHKREVTSSICDPINNITKVQCYCINANSDRIPLRSIVKSANCHLVNKNMQADDSDWDAFEALKNANKITFSNTMGIAMSYIPTNAIKHMDTVLKLEIKYGDIEKIHPFAFANLTLVEEITLSNNQIKTLSVNAFAHHRDLSSLGLDTNDLTEIIRDVFVDLPSLEYLYLTNNRITTIHDRAFMHLINLKELEIDRNSLFSLNSETFSGLAKLQKLELSANGLEVIGDNTFLPLTDLKSLNLDGNKIQMLDEKAFSGLTNLNALSLANNNLTRIDNVKIFEGLDALNFLSLKSNQLVELNAKVIAPILSNFYKNISSLDVEENNFPCDCRLDWFMLIINNTQNKNLKLAIENLKCMPDAKVKDLWSKVEDSEKNGNQTPDEETPTQNNDYEYYDDVQLNGKLFYVDIRDLINCTGNKMVTPLFKNVDITQTTVKLDVTTTTKATTSQLTTPSPVTTTVTVNELQTARTTESNKATSTLGNEIKKDSTTMRLSTVSEKPMDNYDQNMAADEARTEKATKAHRSIQEDIKVAKHTNNAHMISYSASYYVSFVVLAIRLFV